MVFQSNTYSVLLVSASEKFNTATMSLLPSTDYWPVTVAGNLSEARRCTLEGLYDIILVNSPLPDGSGLQFCMDSCAGSEAGVLLLIKNDLFADIYYKVLPYGVVTLSKPTSTETIAQHLRILCAMRERLRAAGKKQSTVEEKMEELRQVNRAKWLLIEGRGMTEEAAHRYILSQAMERRISKKEMAERIIRAERKTE